MRAEEVETLLLERGALLEGHFILSSGLHSARYMQCARALEHPCDAESLGRALAALAPSGVETVVSPALGGVLIGHEVARALGRRFVFTEREASGAMALRRGFELREGERVVVVEDVVTTAKSSGEVVALVEAAKARALAVLSIVDRSVSAPKIQAAVKALLKLPIEAFQPEACPMCAKNIPAVKPGSRPTAERERL